jgi:hypothetical protein
MKIPKEAQGLATVVAAVLAVGTLIGYVPPYSWFAHVQLALFHINFVTLSFLLTMIVVGAPLWFAVYRLEQRFGTKVTWFTPLWTHLDQLIDGNPGKCVLIGAVCIAMGGYFAVVDLGRGPLTQLSVRDLEDGRAPTSTYVELTDGTPLESANIRFKANSTTYRYIPVFYHADKPVLFLRISDHSAKTTSLVHARGILEENGLEGELRSSLEARDLLGPRHYVLGVGRTPNPMVGAAIAGFGLMLALIGLIWARSRMVVTRA